MFRLVNLDDRAALEHDGRAYDLAELSGDPALSDPRLAIARHRDLHDLAARAASAEGGVAVEPARLGPPMPAPCQVFGIGLNYRDHAAETGASLPPAPLTFTKFPSCIAGPTADVPLSGDTVDWEVELVVVIGDACAHVDASDAWSVVAGLTLGQDISDRTVQRTGVPPQFSLGKSFPRYGPTGPAIVSVDAFDDPDDIGLWCEVAGERMQDSRSRQLVFPIPTLVAYLSSIVPLAPGDLIFTGTPAGVGMARGRFLAAGEVVVSGAEVIGELRNTCVSGRGPLEVRPGEADVAAGSVG
jgi:2-keto-4-pentenoate hydratase/2-oxohepta-3-ene-1,7-dioic acid hydratase in catechol pathway